MITPDTISNILSAARIEEVIADFVSLKRRGTNYIGLCPFHNEKTPSFTVSPAKGIFKCFGCGKAGNTVNFLMEHEHYTYPEALRFLAKRYHIEIAEEVQTPEKIQEQNEKETLFLLNQFAQKYFEQILFETEDGKAIGLTYLQERGFREEYIRKFQLGYSKEGWEDFSSHAVSEGYKSEYLVKTGLSIQKEDRLIDRFHGRVMFPIHSASGRIIGFGGRILSADKQTAKYLNSPESDIYNKSKSLYGLYYARNAMVAKNNCYLVEGYTDVISLHQAGIENVVASSGTSLTHDQVKLIQRYTQNITILYDGDPAGIKASLRGIDMILEQGMNVRIVLFPEKEDPDSFARTHRSAEVEEFIAKNAVNFILFKTRLLLKETAGDPVKKAELVKEIVNTIAIIPDAITRTFFTRECSSLLAVPEQTLMNEMNKILRKKFSKKLQEEGGQPYNEPEDTATAAPQIEFDLDSSESQEKEIIRLLLQFGSESITLKQKNGDEPEEETQLKVADLIIQDLVRDEIPFESPVCRQIFNEMAELQQKGVIPDKDYFLHHPDPILATLAIDLIILPYEYSHGWEKKQVFMQFEIDRLLDFVYPALHGYKAKKIERMIADNQKRLKEIKSAKEDIEEITNCLTQQKRLQEIRRRIQGKELGRTIIK
ncbi:MAG TPA: DNA primase [Bacteroidales bacterium]|nr:DNA primase [Bacteroidales bacterium]